jgi:hypothetical protein
LILESANHSVLRDEQEELAEKNLSPHLLIAIHFESYEKGGFCGRHLPLRDGSSLPSGIICIFSEYAVVIFRFLYRLNSLTG